MKNIKIRAWSSTYQEWHYFNLHREMDVSNFYDNFSDYGNIGQYTGIKNLYHGDFTEDGLIFFSDLYLGWFVRLFEQSYKGEEKPLYDCCFDVAIGNMYENPKLLEIINKSKIK